MREGRADTRQPYLRGAIPFTIADRVRQRFVVDPFAGSGGFLLGRSAMALVELIQAVTGLILALAIFLAVVGAFYRR